MTSRRPAMAGALLAIMLAASVAHGLGAPLPAWIAGLAAWLAGAMLWRSLSASQRRQCGLLTGVGLAALALGATLGVAPPWPHLLDQNQGILALIAGVSFVQIAAPPVAAGDRPAPRGPGAFLKTLAGLNVLGAAINITALILVGDRIAHARRLAAWEVVSLSRAFSLAAFYSPFIGGMALALNQAPEASFATVATFGVVLAACGIGHTYATTVRRRASALREFAGYPLRADVLRLPVALAAAVFAFRAAWPEVPVLTTIALLAPAIAWTVLARRIGPGRASARAAQHVVTRLPGMTGELALFLSAGVLAVGLGSAFAAVGLALPVGIHAGGAAAAALLAVLVAAAAGLHPIVTLSALVPLLAPLALPPEAMVVLFVAGWSIGCTVCPFSGTNLVLQARHGGSPWVFPTTSAGYALWMWTLASLVLVVLSAAA